MLQLKQLSNVLWQLCHRASTGALTNYFKLSFAAYITSSLFCSRIWLVEVFARERPKVAKNIHNLKNQCTVLQKMKGVLNSTELCAFEDRPPTYTHACSLDISLPVNILCFFILEGKWIIFVFKNQCRCSKVIRRLFHYKTVRGRWESNYSE